jgi:hypothetical protein
MQCILAGEAAGRRERRAQSIADGMADVQKSGTRPTLGGCVVGWLVDYGITDRSDLARGGYGSKTGRWWCKLEILTKGRGRGVRARATGRARALDLVGVGVRALVGEEATILARSVELGGGKSWSKQQEQVKMQKAALGQSEESESERARERGSEEADEVEGARGRRRKRRRRDGRMFIMSSSRAPAVPVGGASGASGWCQWCQWCGANGIPAGLARRSARAQPSRHA